ncbi:MAG: hypothetical protein FWH44_04910 [Methanomassiliicoccaceae archaeon]|nr:hypothetical protein [Methanomassiliicoccaceae archaeon]
MMEFTLARVCMSVCGLVLLAAVIVPVTGMYESKTVSTESNVSEDIGKLVDGFYYSEMELFIVPMSDILPDTSSYIEFDGHVIIMTTARGIYKSGTNALIISDGTPFRYGDAVRFTKSDGTITAERLS